MQEVHQQQPHLWALCCLLICADMVSGWKSEREQYLTQIRARSLDKKMMAGKCGAELHEVAQNLVLGHARSLQGQVQDKIQALQAAANRAVEVFYKDVSTTASCS
jgi:hypothetical protein